LPHVVKVDYSELADCPACGAEPESVHYGFAGGAEPVLERVCVRCGYVFLMSTKTDLSAPKE
jgi:ribosomal protein S27AE